ncbi:hypothetical protein BJ165DRAFT_1409869 [Panaeolus papilionaceus]|nr:hypothetical protein BJ165DRAFT_1409869 [Panaeolus papilionaceus]
MPNIGSNFYHRTAQEIKKESNGYEWIEACLQLFGFNFSDLKEGPKGRGGGAATSSAGVGPTTSGPPPSTFLFCAQLFEFITRSDCLFDSVSGLQYGKDETTWRKSSSCSGELRHINELRYCLLDALASFLLPMFYLQSDKCPKAAALVHPKAGSSYKGRLTSLGGQGKLGLGRKTGGGARAA